MPWRAAASGTRINHVISAQRVAVPLVVGSLVGVSGQYYLSLGFYSLIPWGIAGLALGWWSRKGEPAIVGALYGFALCFVFMVWGYNGSASLIGRLPFFALIGAFGAVCGLPLGIAGFLVKNRFPPTKG